MSKAVSKAPDSGQVTSATPTRTGAAGRADAQDPARTRKPCALPAAAQAAAAAVAAPKPSWPGAGWGNPPQPSSTRHRREGEKRDLTALELRSYARRLGTAVGILGGQWELGTA